MEPILTAKEMCDPEVDHIGIMAYAAYFSRFKPVRSSAEKVVMDVQPKNCYIGITVSKRKGSCVMAKDLILPLYLFPRFFFVNINNNFSLVHVLCMLYYVHCCRMLHCESSTCIDHIFLTVELFLIIICVDEPCV